MTNSHLLTVRERKVSECVAESVRAKRECDVGQKRASQIVEAVDALINALDDANTADQLSPWEESFYEGEILQ